MIQMLIWRFVQLFAWPYKRRNQKRYVLKWRHWVFGSSIRITTHDLTAAENDKPSCCYFAKIVISPQAYTLHQYDSTADKSIYLSIKENETEMLVGSNAYTNALTGTGTGTGTLHTTVKWHDDAKRVSIKEKER